MRVEPRGLGVQDHPRIRGEHAPYRSFSASLRGSSPHTRGAQTGRSSQLVVHPDHPRIRGEHNPEPSSSIPILRIIPAYAGSTTDPGLEMHWHRGSSPHTRGARAAGAISVPGCQDHPRIRGEHVLAHDASVRALGIIPAYAGSTVTCVSSSHATPGSSPHTRGAPCET